jgi:hypothetical protein
VSSYCIYSVQFIQDLAKTSQIRPPHTAPVWQPTHPSQKPRLLPLRLQQRNRVFIKRHTGFAAQPVALTGHHAVGFEQLAAQVAKPPKSVHRMLSQSGNPTMSNLAAIF